MKDFPLPNLKWTRGVDSDGTAWVKLDTDKLPIEVFGWTADTRNNTRLLQKNSQQSFIRPHFKFNDLISNSTTFSGYIEGLKNLLFKT